MPRRPWMFKFHHKKEFIKEGTLHVPATWYGFCAGFPRRVALLGFILVCPWTSLFIRNVILFLTDTEADLGRWEY